MKAPPASHTPSGTHILCCVAESVFVASKAKPSSDQSDAGQLVNEKPLKLDVVTTNRFGRCHLLADGVTPLDMQKARPAFLESQMYLKGL